MPDRPVLSVDLGSPYAYLAVERAPALLGAEPEIGGELHDGDDRLEAAAA